MSILVSHHLRYEMQFLSFKFGEPLSTVKPSFLEHFCPLGIQMHQGGDCGVTYFI